MQILYLPEVWHCDSDGSGAAITDFGGARISDELALKKRRIQIVASYAMPELPVNLFLIWIGLQLLTAILKGIEAWYGDKDYWEKEKIWNFVREKILPPVIIVGGGIGTILFVAWINGRL